MTDCTDTEALAMQWRRTPQQERSQQTVEALLSATATLLDEVGYDGLTTKAIAARAGTSIGAFYQFFANKEAAINELVQRYRGEIRRFLEDAVSRSGGGISVAWTDDAIAGLAHIYENLPGFRGVWSGQFAQSPLAEQAERLRREVFDALDDALGRAFPDVDADRRRRCLGMTLETAKLLLGSDQELVKQELPRMLGLYVSSYFGTGRAEDDAPAMPLS
jgi:AcrR family transcriptional regulator